MPLPMQVKLLRVLQERLFDRVGGGKPIQADVRDHSGDPQGSGGDDPHPGFSRGSLLSPQRLPHRDAAPARALPTTSPCCCRSCSTAIEEQHKGIIRLTQRAMESLMQYPWPGNVREGSNLIERLLILYPNRIVDVADLPGRYRLLPVRAQGRAVHRDGRAGCPGRRVPDAPSAGSGLAAPLPMQLPQEGLNLKEMLADLEVELIRQALESQDGVVARAADLLSMRRTTLVEKMKKYGMSKDN